MKLLKPTSILESMAVVRKVLLLTLVLTMSMQLGIAQKSKLKDKNKYKEFTHTSEDGKYTYTTVYGDPLKARLYTLKNGLRVFMTVNKNEPRVFTAIAVRTGSNNDPQDATGLAHYLEHMLFKGTDKYGTADYDKEKALLDQIEEMYETYRTTKDEKKRKEMYAEIDRLSGEAAKFAIASEYDKMLSAIGAKGTNAFTSFEQTVYINDVPANQIGKWLEIEGERFRNPVIRLFHTELEAVYEEKNRSLDNDGRAAYTKLFEGLFPRHNYGQQTTIGTIDHLKNPSIKKIKNYYQKYYVPNNMAICLSGDFDPEQVIGQIDKQFGYFQSKDVTPYIGAEEAPITGVQEYEVFGPDAEMLYMGFRVPGTGHADGPVIEMIDYILSNSTAGLIDLNIVKQQKALRAWSGFNEMKDYGVHMLGGNPKEGSSLEELKELLLEQLEFIKNGDFDHSLIQSVINNMEIDKMRAYERNWNRSMEFVDAYISGQDWSDYIQRLEKIRKVTPEDIQRVANEYFGDNYVVVYKRTGDRQDIKKVEKPQITPVDVNRDAQSPFLKDLLAQESPKIMPRFLDYKKDIVHQSLENKVPLHYVKNEENGLFTMYYLVDFGKQHDKDMAFAIDYLEFVGTDKYSADAISKKFYELGTNFGVFSSDEQIYVYVTGLQKNFSQSVELFEHLLLNAKPDDKALEKLVANKMKERADRKLDKYTILYQGLSNYGQYGKRNPFNDVLSETQLKALKADKLVEKLNKLTSFQHKVLYYGPEKSETIASELNRLHKTPKNLLPTPQAEPYKFQDTKKSKVYFVEYDMVQAEIMWLTKSVPYNPGLAPKVRMFNEYYGGNMSSIVFQTIRESKALAYSTWSSFTSPRKQGDPYYVRAYVGTQADKLHEAMAGMMELLNEIPRSDNLFENSKASIRNQMETERVTRTSILFNYESAKRRGLDRDIRADIYNSLDGLKFEDVQAFHKEYVAGKEHHIMIMGSKENIDLKSLEKYGEVVELGLEEVFGY